MLFFESSNDSQRKKRDRGNFFMLNSSLESRLMDQSADCAEINAFSNFEIFILVNERGILPHFSNRHFSATIRRTAPVLVSN